MQSHFADSNTFITFGYAKKNVRFPFQKLEIQSNENQINFTGFHEQKRNERTARQSARSRSNSQRKRAAAPPCDTVFH